MHSHVLSINHSFVFEFERNFDVHDKLRWAKEHYRFPYYAISIYLVTIHLLKNYMESRPPMKLKKSLFAWNLFLAIFNTIAAMRGVPVFFFDLSVHGFHFSVCNNNNATSVTLFWSWMFLVFKFVEFGDTVFIILRKRELIFLHWYHHVTVLLSSWFIFGELAAPARWMANVNAIVHAFMYTYYAARSLHVKVPQSISMLITSVQILQMIVGASVCIYIGFSRFTGMPCAISESVSSYLFIMYTTYLFLFVNYFYWTYIKPDKKLKSF